MSRANSVGFGLVLTGIIVAIAARPMGIPSWIVAIIWVIVGFYWAFGRQTFFPDEVRERREDKR